MKSGNREIGKRRQRRAHSRPALGGEFIEEFRIQNAASDPSHAFRALRFAFRLSPSAFLRPSALPLFVSFAIFCSMDWGL
jgi:hypothetical protein